MSACHMLDGVTIPAECLWKDEFDWQPATGASTWSCTGALIVDLAAKKAGRPITLTGADDMGWMQRADVSALYALAADPATPRLLTLADGRSFTVIFRPGEAPVSADRVGWHPAPPSEWPYKAVTIRLMEI